MKKIKKRLVTGIFILLILQFSCSRFEDAIDYKEEMRQLVIELSDYARQENENFILIPQNGHELLSVSGEEDGADAVDYLVAIHGLGQEDLFFGYDEDDQASPQDENNYLMQFLNRGLNNGKTILVTDYCSSHGNIDSSYAWNKNAGYISFAAPDRELSVIPDYPQVPFYVNQQDIVDLNEIRNFLYLINPENFTEKDQFLNQLKNTDYDLLILDAFYDGEMLTSEDVSSLKSKFSGGRRLVIAYMSIGEAEEYRYYWNEEWKQEHPSWLKEQNPSWEGNYKVEYWNKEWQNILYGNEEAYLDKILNAGFDGVYLDIIDAFEYFE